MDIIDKIENYQNMSFDIGEKHIISGYRKAGFEERFPIGEEVIIIKISNENRKVNCEHCDFHERHHKCAMYQMVNDKDKEIWSCAIKVIGEDI